MNTTQISHRVTTDDRSNTMTCECGFTFNGTPQTNPFGALTWGAKHGEIIKAERRARDLIAA